MKPTTTQYLVLGGIGVAAVGYAFMKKKSADTAATSSDTPPASLPASTATQVTTAPVVTLNKSLVLKKGISAFNEVMALQALLGVTADGSFGTQTEAALLVKKAVKEISLAAYATAASVNLSALAIGSRVMSNKKPYLTIYRATPLANNTYNLDSEAVGTVTFGQEAGTIKMLSTYKTKYLIALPGQTTIYGWVLASDVTKI